MKFILVVALLFSLFAPVPGFAETYNFIFTKPKKGTRASIPSPMSEDDEEENEPETKLIAPPPQPVTQASIIINNQTGSSFTQSGSPLPAGSGPAPSSVPTTAIPVPEEPRSWLRMGLAGGYFVTNKGGTGSEVPSYGGLFHLNLAPSTVFGITAVLGLQKEQFQRKPVEYAALEFEFNPFSAEKNRYGVIEFNLLAGLNHRVTESFGEGVHCGLRLNLNLSTRFGLTAAARLGSESRIAEFGLVTRL